MAWRIPASNLRPEILMKPSIRRLATVAAVSTLFCSGLAQADSGYGYQTTITNAASAQATLRINVNIPKLILLRVGDANTQNALTFTATPAVTTNPAAPSVGNNQAADWDAAAPTFTTTPATSAVTASIWHNNSALASLTCAVTTPFTGPMGLVAADVTVTSAGALTHPGGASTNTGSCDGTTATAAIARNAVQTGTWTFGVSPTALATAPATSAFQVLTYTATTL
jgi:hypothetical protein